MNNYNLKILLFLIFIITINICVSFFLVDVTNVETNKEIKILNLVLYSSSYTFDKMKMITEKFYNKFKNVDTIYYKFSNDLDTDTELRGNVLHIKGDETYIPGILQKTIKAFEYFKNDLNNYDYIVRSNVSTIIRFDVLSDDLKTNPIDYGCSYCFGLEKEPNIHGIHEIHNNEIFSSGTSIILAANIVRHIIKHTQLIDMNTIDDVSIGKFILENIPNIKMTPILRSSLNDSGFYIVSHQDSNEKIYEFIKNNVLAIFRHNNNGGNREKDINQMITTIELLEKNDFERR